MKPEFDVLAIGRCSVDLYGWEIGTRLEDVDSFKKSVGGCPANVAIGTARLGLRSALLSRVGNEQMGRFILDEMTREGVDTSAVVVDDERLTALVLLAARDRHSSPHIFYRESCADMALCEDDVDPELVGRARCIVVTGTHFSTPQVAAASWKAIHLARQAGAKIVFDIDFRPSLWGLAALADGEARLVLSDHVQEVMGAVIRASDVVVGTEEEICAATNQADLSAALAGLRRDVDVTIVCKRGANGCEIYPASASGASGGPVRGAGFVVEVVNTVGAGDAFLSGFLRGWLRGETWETTATLANACGAIAVSRLQCSSEYPTWPELTAFLDADSPSLPDLAHVHWATTRRSVPDELFILAVDHRTQFEEIADRLGVERSRLSELKRIAVAAAGLLARDRPNVGIICDAEYGSDALVDADALSLWTARPIEAAGVKPLQFNIGDDVGTGLLTWPRRQTVKCLCYYDADDPPELRARQERQLVRLNQACKTLGREFLLEIIAPNSRDSVPETIARLYDLGIRPDWWKLEPIQSQDVWQALGDTIAARDPFCRGILILGMTSSLDEVRTAFVASTACPLVRGFAIGRAIFGTTTEEWLAGRISDAEAEAAIAGRFEQVIDTWCDTHARHTRARDAAPIASILSMQGR